ncbi:hypothetical protein [Streptomyces sp. B93]|uniref:hypothetical protein n=1 Tax=Streptomyces sp. B93 TaxID=2824875 RepID=UPI001B397467|nr:hypothetical protein [Streptomyces sp. B93]MBQ1088131.1 hypothetical protein [Streptomyces sp. B93]
MTDNGFEERVRDLLSEDAYTISPSPAPYPAIRRRGVAWRRRRVAATGAALAALVAAPVGAYAMTGADGSGGGKASPAASSTAAAPTPTPAPTPTGADTRGVLLDGITYEQAAEDLEYCVGFRWPSASEDIDYGDPADYRVLLAMRSTGDSNAPGDGRFVVAVADGTPMKRLICNVKDGDDGPGRSFTGIDMAGPDAGPVVPDANAHKLYSQSFLDKGNWQLPFRWAGIGTVEDSVARVTVEYGGETSEAVLDDGWYVATGELDQQVTKAPHVKGFDGDGKLVYDSDRDTTYSADLP